MRYKNYIAPPKREGQCLRQKKGDRVLEAPSKETGRGALKKKSTTVITRSGN